MAWGAGSSRMLEPKYAKPKAVDLGPTIVLDEERCIVCQRCVRFDQIITREDSLRTEDRGAHTIIATATGEAVRLRLHRKRHRAVPGRRADVENLPLPLAPVGQPPHDDDLHAVQRRLPDARRRARQRAAAHDERRRGRRALRRLAVRPRPLQRRLRERRAPAHDAALERVRSATWVQIDWSDALDLWAEKIEAAIARRRPAARRRDRRRPAAERRGLSRRAPAPRARGSRTSTTAPARRRTSITAGSRTTSTSRTRTPSSRSAGRPRSSRRCSTCESARRSRATARG